MNKLKFLHCSDIHLDMPFTSLGGDTKRSSARRQDLKDVLSFIVDTAKIEKVHMILISGDLYEHAYIRRSTINHVNELFKSIPQIKVVMMPGNHDPYASNSLYQNYSWADNVFILSPEKSFFCFEDINACVFGMGFENSNRVEPAMPDITLNNDYYNILMLHGTVDMNFGKTVLNPVSSHNLADWGMDYAALGHFHKRAEDIGGYGCIFNPGSPEPLGFDEEDEHGVFLCTLYRESADLRKKLEYEFIRTSKKQYYNMELDVTGLNTYEKLVEKLKDLLKNVSSNGLVSIKLKGFSEYELGLSLKQIEEDFNEKVFFIKLIDDTRPPYSIDEISNEPGLRGLFVRKMLRKIDDEKDERNKEKLKRSLDFGLKALEKGKIDL
ncbi:metallophosphoesterase family protein [Pseudobacteroides cellulosolvens]|uniref:Calcineurin-like phosphoesterase superfamily domain containing protein n=1 Tax=Pseudobacteroides cellulosolvens ATCC 35603 = DSM 2933 TaxID=398512 RepID=A0A0L6JVR5_9FIRM|nr:DNA repair exonuclease [Pseudobacteroides cellulosolvens]KNY29809.1 Calcineurin-like phosphoesterase superfamily domain containing protein [Pseudobacteroides cellulosolvens ATCC 35603 = DSM 2933]